MFLDTVLARNPALVDFAVELHRTGAIPPNTYVLDLDALEENARLLGAAAKRHGLHVFAMTKQIGRNPEAVRAIMRQGMEEMVAVDFAEARQLMACGARLGNVGHIVQVPFGLTREMLASEPSFVTVFSVDMARRISDCALEQNRVQPLLLRVQDPASQYPCQEGGFDETNVLTALEQIKKLPGVQAQGLTAFPCMLYDEARLAVLPTPNLAMLLRCRDLLEKAGAGLTVMNMPSANSVSTMEALGRLGATHVEPGHAFTGTTPLNAAREEPEIPAMVYVSEVSHHNGSWSYFYGGGLYPRSNFVRALVVDEKGTRRIVKTGPVPSGNIDYYGSFEDPQGVAKPGNVLLGAFRTQVFVTRSLVVPVAGLRGNSPRALGMYDSQGRRLDP